MKNTVMYNTIINITNVCTYDMCVLLCTAYRLSGSKGLVMLLEKFKIKAYL